MSGLGGLYPGEVESYDPGARSCRVRIPGLTDGSSVLPEAFFNNPIGDRAGDTEIRILPGDKVWLMFEEGDPRFPVIMGYRTPRAGNSSGWRRWRHENIQLTAHQQFVVTVGSTTYTITSGLANLAGADLHVSGNILSGGNIAAAGDVVAAGNIGDQGGTKTMAGMRNTFNTHPGHFSPSNVVPGTSM